MKAGVCLSSILSYITDKGKILFISNKGILIESIEEKEKATTNDVSFIYLVMVIIYNPIIPLFYKPSYWIASHLAVIVFFGLRIWSFKKKN